MALRANRPGASAPAPTSTPAPTEVNQEQEQVTQEPVGNPPLAPAVSQSTAVAKPGSVQDMNAGILENIDDMGTGGNYVTVDGESFLYKGSQTTAKEIDIQLTYGKRFYQWVDESNPEAKVFHNSDTKLDDRYKLKFEIRWLEQGEEEGDEPVEYTMSLSTTSAMQFINYVQALSKAGHGVGGVWSRMTISRHLRSGSKTERYSRVDFEGFSLETGEALGIKSVSK
jgi:hypothetical protein